MERLFGEEQTEPSRPDSEAPRGGPGDGALPEDAPLATRLRPATLDELVGQERLLAPGSALRRAIEEGRPHSMILHGPPGSGKTTLARLVAQASGESNLMPRFVKGYDDCKTLRARRLEPSHLA